MRSLFIILETGTWNPNLDPIEWMRNWDIRPTLRYMPAVIAVGIALGVASHAIGFREGLIEAVVLHTLTSFLIGCSLIFVVSNSELPRLNQSGSGRLVLLGLVFMGIGVLAAEIELLVQASFFSAEPYRLFSGEGIYIFDAILSIILGFSMFTTLRGLRADEGEVDAKEAEGLPAETQLTKLPVKIGDTIHLLPIMSISQIEAADKYAYVYTTSGEKHLCDYSLAYLESRLPEPFARVHRSHIVNVEHVVTIQPFDKKRYTLSFSSDTVPSVRSSVGYQEKVRSLIKL